MAQMKAEPEDSDDSKDNSSEDELLTDHEENEDDSDDERPISGNPLSAMSDVKLGSKCGS